MKNVMQTGIIPTGTHNAVVYDIEDLRATREAIERMKQIEAERSERIANEILNKYYTLTGQLDRIIK
jgi:hypothetical protein